MPTPTSTPTGPGVLTLTPVVTCTCSNQTTTLDPIYLVLTDNGVSGYAPASVPPSHCDLVLIWNDEELGRNNVYVTVAESETGYITINGSGSDLQLAAQFSDGSWAKSDNISEINWQESGSVLCYPMPGYGGVMSINGVDVEYAMTIDYAGTGGEVGTIPLIINATVTATVRHEESGTYFYPTLHLVNT
jgi:hypothetical protein